MDALGGIFQGLSNLRSSGSSKKKDKVNDKILSVIRYILFFVFVIGLIIIIYLNQKYSTIKLIGK